MTRAALGAIAAGLLASGCYLSGTPEDDGGVDAGVDGGNDPCRAGAYVRCVGGCPGRCTDGSCFEELGLCLPALGGHRCQFRTRPPEVSPSPSCPDGWACWVNGVGTPADGDTGYCAPPDACLLASPDLPAHRCFWSDGTEVARVPSGGECPNAAYDEIVWAACGDRRLCSEWAEGECGGGIITRCAGVSEERYFGLCHYGENACDPENPALIELCELDLRVPCACMVTEPPAPATVEPYGYLVPLDACELYARRYPGQIRCATP